MYPDNRAIYNDNWQFWLDMKVHGPASRWLRSLIRSQLDAMPHPERIYSILDVGCGEGTITYHLARHFPKAKTVGIDFSETGIRCAQARYNLPNLEFIRDVPSAELARNYDLVTAFEILEHVEDWRAFLSRISHSARCSILLSFPTGQMRPFEKDMGHCRNFKRGEVEQFLLSCGFQPGSLYYAGFPFYSPLYRNFCNLTHSPMSAFVTGTYGLPKRVASHLVYCLFRFLSTRSRLGDQFCGLFLRAT